MISLQSKQIFSTKTLVTASLLVGISITLKAFLSFSIPIAGLPALKIGFSVVPIMMNGILFGPIIGFISGVIADIIGFLLNPIGAYFPGFTLAWGLFGFVPGFLGKLILNKERPLLLNLLNTLTVLSLSIGIIFLCFNNNVLSLLDGRLYLYEQPITLLPIIGFLLIVLFFIFAPAIAKKLTQKQNYYYTLDKIFFIVAVTRIISSILLDTYNLSLLMGKGFFVFLPARLISNFITIPLDAYLLTLLLSVITKFTKSKN